MAHLKQWYYCATHCRLPPIIEAAQLLSHAIGMASFDGSRARSPMASSRGSTAWCRLPKKVRGYRSMRNLTAMVDVQPEGSISTRQPEPLTTPTK
jgi:transposase